MAEREWAIVVTTRDNVFRTLACTTVSGFATEELALEASARLNTVRATESVARALDLAVVSTVIVRLK